jgi:hypothetical protein
MKRQVTLIPVFYGIMRNVFFGRNSHPGFKPRSFRISIATHSGIPLSPFGSRCFLDTAHYVLNPDFELIHFCGVAGLLLMHT